MTVDLLEPYLLASASPRRRELLAALDVRFTVMPTHVPEIVPAGTAPETAALAIARDKAAAAASRVAAGTIIAGDTVVALGNLVLGKPADREHAARMLAMLSGTTHRVISAVALWHVPSGLTVSGFDATSVTMRVMTASEIDAYVASGEALGKAGAYAIQETADRFVVHREGAFDTVVGFPCALFLALRDELAARVGRRGEEGARS